MRRRLAVLGRRMFYAMRADAIVRAIRWLNGPSQAPPSPAIEPPISRELLDLRMRFAEALDAVPRDQAEVNRIRGWMELLENPVDAGSFGYRRGRLR